MIIQRELKFEDLTTRDAQAIYDYIVVQNNLEDELDYILNEAFTYNTPTAEDITRYLLQNYVEICDKLNLLPEGILSDDILLEEFGECIG